MWIVKPAGNISALTFSFHDINQKPVKPKIVNLEVDEHRGTDGWVNVWHLRGAKRLKAVEYGRSYGGLREAAVATPLSVGRSYRVIARGEFRMGPGGSTIAYFTIGEAGDVVVTDPPK